MEGQNQDWVNQRIWLSLQKIGSQKFRNWIPGSATNKSMKFPTTKTKDETVEGSEDELEFGFVDLLDNRSEDLPEDSAFRNRWIQHMSLQDDAFRYLFPYKYRMSSDPIGIKVRPVKGKEGISYLTPGALTNSLTYVYGPLIEELEALGYNDGNLAAMPYE